MVSKCANPICLASFQYREGRLFRFPKRNESQAFSSHSVQHFWLCGSCCEIYSLEYVENHGVALKPRVERAPTASRHFIAVA
jgi:hypothetical protein